MIGKKLTIFSISEFLATTVKQQFTIVGFDEKSQRHVIKPRGKRKKFYFGKFKKYDLVFEGWEIPFQTDMESSNIFRGNACINLVGNADVIKNYIENRNLNQKFDTNTKGNILLIDPRETSNGEEQESLLYPDIHSHHAVIQNLKNKK